MKQVLAAVLALGLLTGTTAMAQELLSDGFASDAPTVGLKGWEVFGLLGGTAKPLAAAGAGGDGVLLGTTRSELMSGAEGWQGCLVRTAAIEVTPGRKYRLRVDARGEGILTMGVFEYGWKHSARRLATPSTSQTLAYAEREFVFEYVPSSDGVMFVRPFFQVGGWLKKAELRKVSFMAVAAGKGEVSLKAGHFATTPHGRLPITVRSSAWPVKLLLYGPSGECGPGGDMGGAAGFVDIFKGAAMLDGAGDQEQTVACPIPSGAIEGSCRLVAVEPESGAQATVHFSVLSPARLRVCMALAQKATPGQGARILFLGDSLTALFPGRNYPSIVDRALHWGLPGAATVINAGVGGDSVLRLAARLNKDVIEKNPTRVFIFEGANSCKRPYNPKTGQLGDWAVPRDKYEAGYRDLVKRLTDKGIQVTVMTMAPGDRSILEAFEAQARGMGEAKNFWCLPEDVAAVVAIQKRIAAEFKADVLDTNAVLTAAMLEREKARGREYMHVDDGVHLSEYGNREVAFAVLRYLGGVR